MRRPWLLTLAIGSLALFAPGETRLAGQAAPRGEWRYYGADAGSTKYSPLDQIDAGNVGSLRVAWTWDSPDLTLVEQNRQLRAFGYEVTPIMIGGTLYASTSLSQVAAIDAATGKTLWVHDPKSYLAGRPTNLGFVHRGVAHWSDGRQARIFLGAGDAHLVAIDARTGEPVGEFGGRGRVNLAAAIPNAVNATNYAVSSPPVIYQNVVIVGSSINDFPDRKEAPRGDIQAFDARDGRPLWIFHTVPQAGEFGNETWGDDSWKYTGNTNVWSLMSVDEESGYVYLPIGTPTNDWYGGHRPGDNVFAESLVALDAKDGRRVWHFQAVHHGLWDYDFPAAPVLCDVRVDGRTVKAVAQISKQGFVYVFDRVTGRPVWPIEERSVPPSPVPGEQASATQPFPTKPPPFERQESTADNLIDFTPELREEAITILEQYDHGPLFTPPTTRGTINLPGWAGGANWWGAACDPETGYLYIPSVTAPIVVKLRQGDPARTNFTYLRDVMGAGTSVSNVKGPRGLPLFKPPYARITAVDLTNGAIAWQVPHGEGPREEVSKLAGRDVGPLGSGGGGGPLLTRTLLFVAQGAGGRGGSAGGGAPVLRAFDKATGKVVAEIVLPGQPSGTPMTYLAGDKQFIALTTSDGRLVALSLP